MVLGQMSLVVYIVLAGCALRFCGDFFLLALAWIGV